MSRALGSRYTLGESIGRGAMGEAFRGTDQQGNALAFKLLHAELARDPELVERFVKERSILLALRGENLVEVRDLVIEGDTLAIVMDLVTGGDLRAAIRNRGPFTPAEACRIGAGIARGLEVVHGTGIIHRDIKPANILLGGPAEAPVPKLSDFGISSLIDDAHMRSTTVVGTPQYIAPEIGAGRSAMPASDLYALGIVLYELAVGVTPFAGGSVMAVLLRHGTTNAARPEGIPDPLWDMITWLLAKEPGQRPADAAQAAEALEALVPQLVGLPAAPRLTRPLEPVPVAGTTPTGAVSLPEAPPAPALALPPLPPGPVVPGTGVLGTTGVLPPSPGLLRAYAAIAEPQTGHHEPSTIPPSPTQPTGPGSGEPGTPDYSYAPGPVPGPKSRTALFVVLGIGLAVVLAGAGILFWYLNGHKPNAEADPGTPVQTQTPAPTGDTEKPTGDTGATTAPNLVGKTEARARELLPPGVTVAVTQTTSLDVRAGEVSAQDPEPGKPLGDTMKLTVEFGLTDDAPEASALPTPAQGSWLDLDGAVLRGTAHETVLGARVCGVDAPKSRKVVYDLAGNYTRFTGTAALVEGPVQDHGAALLEATVDGVVHDSASISEFSFSELDIDLTGAKKLEFDWSPVSCDQPTTDLGLGSPVFTKAGK